MARQDIAIIGGGAKAAALAAKAWCLREAGVADVHVTIFERDVIGAHWDGHHGYSDGRMQLCTPAERDLGFPYDTTSVGEDVVAAMAARFSWMAYAVREDADPLYANWVNRGRRRPSHAQFARYLRDAVDLSEADLRQGATVTGLVSDGRRWTVRAEIAGSEDDYAPFNGVVVTSPGPQLRRISRVEDDRIFDGESFWRDLGNVRDRAQDNEDPIVIIGFGGTAAAVAAWFVRNGFADREIVLIAEQPSLHPRIDNVFENQLFDDEAAWEALSDVHKIAFADRLNRGVVWASVADELSQAENIAFRYGRARSITHGPVPANGDLPDLYVNYSPEGVTRTTAQGAGLVVDASGFDTWWFADLLPDLERRAIRDGENAKLFANAVQRDLSLSTPPGIATPIPTGLHAPVVSQIQGPGFASLMVLGAMSDRILKPYIDASRA